MITSGNQLVRQSEDLLQGCWFQLLHELLLNGFDFEIIRHDYPHRGLDGWLFPCAALQQATAFTGMMRDLKPAPLVRLEVSLHANAPRAAPLRAY
jgi:hypothetical protein